jgi:hypothetical protein
MYVGMTKVAFLVYFIYFTISKLTPTFEFYYDMELKKQTQTQWSFRLS